MGIRKISCLDILRNMENNPMLSDWNVVTSNMPSEAGKKHQLMHLKA